MQHSAILDTKLVGTITGNFYIPSYQRGFRWAETHIRMLLNDIYENGGDSYCLQPIVVKSLEDGRYELIDGQQRLTSIYLVLKYIQQLMPSVEQKFSLTYQTRDGSQAFLESMDPTLKDKNVDFFHMFNAYATIDAWFNTGGEDKILKAINLYKYFGENVKVIWYEVESSAESIQLFTRLNIGKIPLTNAELVKALFLSKNSDDLTDEMQLEIATSWDSIEKSLHNESLWAFLTNEDPKLYQTRIELIFNMMAQKSLDEKEEFFTFYHFTKRMKTESKVAMWKEIEQFYYVLQEWYENRNLYHKVGYLVSSGYEIRHLKTESESLTKSGFQDQLDDKIRQTLDLTKDEVFQLSYEKRKDRKAIENLLLLFNVETVRLVRDSNEKYSFSRHKRGNWSLEHIHAQNSEGLNRQDDQKMWLYLHRKSLVRLSSKSAAKEAVDAVLMDIDENYEAINQMVFDQLFARITDLLSESEDRSYIDLVSNMALLSMEKNAALNNSTFDVKRDRILEMDRNGEYIPICTRRVFLKYYSHSDTTQLQFWGEDDRTSYIDAMVGENGILTPYLKENAAEASDV